MFILTLKFLFNSKSFVFFYILLVHVYVVCMHMSMHMPRSMQVRGHTLKESWGLVAGTFIH